jgi:hypothetical protein
MLQQILDLSKKLIEKGMWLYLNEGIRKGNRYGYYKRTLIFPTHYSENLMLGQPIKSHQYPRD